ncbi:MAG: bifunctional adenosylcobinamide kinase/adenosylcobinamide-phosphate guanylyltransferase [Synechococcaceae cyanobacterium]|nr:bifunctional adenosylcobinamide kinase/adenosylcobinamide-phosphate guanylyltransferase [Synechococcaceae cyanobacterium]
MEEAENPLQPQLCMVCGPSGSGKSRWAEHLAERSGAQVVYLATGPLLPEDPAWQERLRKHRRRRPEHWGCLEVQGRLCEALAELQPHQLALVDSLGTWVAELLCCSKEEWRDHCLQLRQTLIQRRLAVVLVSEEVSWGVVPATPIGGLFRERLAGLNRELASLCSAHWLVVQGRALDLLSLGQAVPPEI